MGKPTVDLSGRVFGHLTVLSRSEPPAHVSVVKGVYWHCRCECGESAVVRADHLRNGDTSSCSCLSWEAKDRKRRHNGLSSHPLYSRWVAMMARCYQPEAPMYPDYGARGVSVCERWHVLANFIGDMGACPEGHSLDRVDNDGDYTPDNCRWATQAEQNANKRPPVSNRKYLALEADRDAWRERALALGWSE